MCMVPWSRLSSVILPPSCIVGIDRSRSTAVRVVMAPAGLLGDCLSCFDWVLANILLLALLMSNWSRLRAPLEVAPEMFSSPLEQSGSCCGFWTLFSGLRSLQPFFRTHSLLLSTSQLACYGFTRRCFLGGVFPSMLVRSRPAHSPIVSPLDVPLSVGSVCDSV